MSQRFFVETPISAQRAVLTAGEAHHLSHVMRARPGAEVVLFDGSGAEFLARVESLGRSQVELTVVERREVNRELSQRITIGVALPKAQRRGWLVENLVELGVARLVPLATDHAAEPWREQSSERMRRTVIEASKQCGRNRLMEIAAASRLTDFLTAAPDGFARFIAHPNPAAEQSASHRVSVDLFAAYDARTPEGDRDVFLAVGPEGGFTDEEIAEARRCGWWSVDLGPRILRSETAALALVATIARRMFRCNSPAEERASR